MPSYKDEMLGDTLHDAFKVVHGVGGGLLSIFGAGALVPELAKIEQKAGLLETPKSADKDKKMPSFDDAQDAASTQLKVLPGGKGKGAPQAPSASPVGGLSLSSIPTWVWYGVAGYAAYRFFIKGK